MSTKSKELNQQELLNTQNSVENENTNKEGSFKYINEPVHHSPFRVVGNERDGFILVLGKHRLCTPQPTMEDLHEWMNEEQWNIIFNMIASMLEINEEMRKSTLEEAEKRY